MRADMPIWGHACNTACDADNGLHVSIVIMPNHDAWWPTLLRHNAEAQGWDVVRWEEPKEHPGVEPATMVQDPHKLMGESRWFTTDDSYPLLVWFQRHPARGKLLPAGPSCPWPDRLFVHGRVGVHKCKKAPRPHIEDGALSCR